jgi:hypothetical protein
MKKSEQSGVWYGEIRAARGNVIVIRDTELPQASNGRIYLYNTERGAFVEYDETIVSPKLFELEETQRSDAEKQFQVDWDVAYKQFMRSHGKFAANATKENDKKVEKIELPDDDDDLDDDED